MRWADIPESACVAAYCTIGYRSGLYARDHLLKGPRALPHDRVFNHEGVMLHTFAGEPLVRPAAGGAAADEAGGWEETREVHTYARPWRGMAHPAFRVRYFGLCGMINDACCAM